MRWHWWCRGKLHYGLWIMDFIFRSHSWLRTLFATSTAGHPGHQDVSGIGLARWSGRTSRWNSTVFLEPGGTWGTWNLQASLFVLRAALVVHPSLLYKYYHFPSMYWCEKCWEDLGLEDYYGSPCSGCGQLIWAPTCYLLACFAENAVFVPVTVKRDIDVSGCSKRSPNCWPHPNM